MVQKKLKCQNLNKSVISQNVSDNLVSPNKAVLSGSQRIMG